MNNPRRMLMLMLMLSIAPALAAAAVMPKDHLLFVTSEDCQACHNNLKTEDGKDVSIGVEWRASVMAHSAKDPYWQASIRRESIDHPQAVAAIEDECAACHMPMSRYQAKAQGRKGKVFAHLPVHAGGTQMDDLAHDGVSCSICHQIEPDKLGQRDSFNGGFVVDTVHGTGQRPEFGPYDINRGHTTIMQSSARFVPNQSEHVRSAALCASCHTLYTKTRGPDGKVIGELPEQMPYLEWQHSDYRDRKTCQACHMPAVQHTPIVSVLGKPRPRLSRHVFVGGNFLLLAMLSRYSDELGVTALPQELEASEQRTRNLLQQQAARVSVSAAGIADGHLNIDVAVENLTGHKLPTAYPSRRAWLHVKVRDRSGNTVFESGKVDERGFITGNDNDLDPRRYEPHYQRIDSQDQVQIYEGILADTKGNVTTGLLTAIRYIKDNRLLPHGFNKQTAVTDIAVQGRASQDQDFDGAGDRVRYSVRLSGDAHGPFTVDAELWYQPIAYRWAHNLDRYDSGETKRFVSYYKSLSDQTMIKLAGASITVDSGGGSQNMHASR